MIQLGDKPVTRVMVRFKVRNIDWMPEDMLGQNFRSPFDTGIKIFSQQPLENPFGKDEALCLNSLPQILKKNDYKIVWIFHNPERYDYLGFDFVSGLRKEETNCGPDSIPFQIFADFCLEYWWSIKIFDSKLSVNDVLIESKRVKALTIYCENQTRAEENGGSLARKLVMRSNRQLDIETVAERDHRASQIALAV